MDELVLKFVGHDLVSPVADKIHGKLKEVEGGVAASNDSMLSKLGGLATKAAAVVATVSLAAAAAAGTAAVTSIKMAGDFQEAMTQLVTGAGEARENIDTVSSGILKMSSEVGVSAQDLAKGMYMIESAGFRGAAGLDVLRAAAEGAEIGAADMGTVADAVTTILNAYHMKASDAALVTSQLVTTVASGKMHMQDLASSLGTVLAPASALGVDFTQVAGAMATMTAQGTEAATASQSLRFLMAAISGPTAAAAKTFEGLGVGMDEIPGITQQVKDEMAAMGISTSAVAGVLSGPGGLNAAMTMITDAIGKKFPPGSAEYNAALKSMVGGTRGMTAALELTGQNAATWKSNIATIGGAAAEAGGHVKGWSEIQGDFNQKAKDLRNGLDAAAISLGTKLLPYATQFLDWLSQGLPKLQDFVDKIGVVISILGTGSDRMSKFQAILALFGVNFGGATQAASGFYTFLQGAAAFVRKFAEDHRKDFESILSSVQSVMGSILSIIQSVLGFIQMAWKAYGADILNVLRANWDLIITVIKDAFKVIADLFQLVADILKGNWQGAWQDILNIGKHFGDLMIDVVKGLGPLLLDALKLVFHVFTDVQNWLTDKVIELGKAIIGGIIQGIQSAAGGLSDALKNALPGGPNGALVTTLHFAGVPGFALGGMVPGAPGEPRLILAHGGERVQTPAQQAGGQGMQTVNVYMDSELIAQYMNKPNGGMGMQSLVRALQG